MATYRSNLKHVHDQDLFYWDAAAWTAATCVSDTIDLGAAQDFMEIPAHIMWEFSADFSLASTVQTTSPWVGLQAQDSADGSTWAGSFAVIPFKPTDIPGVAGASTINSSNLNAKNIGIGSIKRYSRLTINWPTSTPSLTVKAWLRLGLTA